MCPHTLRWRHGTSLQRKRAACKGALAKPAFYKACEILLAVNQKNVADENGSYDGYQKSGEF